MSSGSASHGAWGAERDTQNGQRERDLRRAEQLDNARASISHTASEAMRAIQAACRRASRAAERGEAEKVAIELDQVLALAGGVMRAIDASLHGCGLEIDTQGQVRAAELQAGCVAPSTTVQ